MGLSEHLHPGDSTDSLRVCALFFATPFGISLTSDESHRRKSIGSHMLLLCVACSKFKIHGQFDGFLK